MSKRKAESRIRITAREPDRGLREAPEETAANQRVESRVEDLLQPGTGRRTALLERAINAFPHPFYVVDVPSRTIVLANRAAGGRSEPPCLALPPGGIPMKADALPCPLEEVVKTSGPSVNEHVFRDGGGRMRTLEVHASPILDMGGNVEQVTVYTVDVTHRKNLETRLGRLATTDELTGLHNRRGLMMLADNFMASALRRGEPVYLLYADLNNLKRVNDDLGHETGDRLLKEVAGLLRKTFRKSDIICRIGGDEFVVLYGGRGRTGAREAAARRLRQNVRRHNMEEQRPYVLSISFGIARGDTGKQCSVSELLHRADSIMYAAKRRFKELAKADGRPGE